MRRYVLALALFGAAALVANSLTAEEKKPDEKDAKLTKKDIGALMKSIHQGEKSAYFHANAELKKDTPDWEALTKDAKSFAEMSAAFKKGKFDYSSPEAYIKNSEALTKATADKDKKAATEAFTGMSKSCTACHYGYPAKLPK